MSKILIVSGSPASSSRTAAVASFIGRVLIQEGIEVKKLAVRDLPAEALIYAQFNHPEIKKAQTLVEESDALVVVSPIYKASYPGILKSFFDLLPEKSLEGKKVLPIATAGSGAHLLSLEYVFKPLFSILGSREISQGVYLVDSQLSYSGDEVNFIDTKIKERLETAVLNLQSSLKTRKFSESNLF